MGRGGNPTEGRCLLGIDVGQTAVKAVIHTAELCPVAVGHRASPVDRSTPGQAARVVPPEIAALTGDHRNGLAGAPRGIRVGRGPRAPPPDSGSNRPGANGRLGWPSAASSVAR